MWHLKSRGIFISPTPTSVVLAINIAQDIIPDYLKSRLISYQSNLDGDQRWVAASIVISTLVSDQKKYTQAHIGCQFGVLIHTVLEMAATLQRLFTASSPLAIS